MTLRPRPLLASLVLAAAAALPSSEAHACGGCFHEANAAQTTVVLGHRMAFSISPTRSVLWDQIKYSGSPGSFAWVLPVKGGAVLEISTDAWFETLDAATSAQIVSPPSNCFGGGFGAPSSSNGCGIGCGAASEGVDLAGGVDPRTTTPTTPPVTVTHEGTVGPYETVTLHANVPNALPSWLTSKGFAIDPSIAPIIDAYTSEGFDFIALRLLPDQGIQQMKPVRVITPGMSPSLPLRMVAAGTGPNVAVTLFVIGEGRWETQNFPSGQLSAGSLTWDFTTQSSDYAAKRLALLAGASGRTWNNAFANQGSLLSQDTVNGLPVFINVGNRSVATLAQAYISQGLLDETVIDQGCTQATESFSAYAASSDQVVDCSSGTGGGDAGTDGGTGGGSSAPPCSSIGPNQIPAPVFACEALDDIAAALVGMHPRDVWLTRLEANLPRAALATDLTLQASTQQLSVSNVFSLTQSTGDPCAPVVPADAGAGSMRDARGIWLRNRLAVYAVILAAVAAALARRRRPVPALSLPAECPRAFRDSRRSR